MRDCCGDGASWVGRMVRGCPPPRSGCGRSPFSVRWMKHGWPGIVNRSRRAWSGPVNVATGWPPTCFRCLLNQSGLHPCITAYPHRRNLRPAGGTGIGNGLDHPETSPAFPGKHRSTDKIARQLTLTFSLDNNTVYADPVVFGAAVAARTKQIQIGFAVVQMAFHHPVKLAAQTALLDNLSHGRLIVGTGRGSAYNAFEYLGFGITVEEGRRRLSEAKDLLVKSWTADNLEFKGQYWQASVPEMRPKPY